MSASFERPAVHPVMACVETLETGLDDVAGVDVAFMRPEERQAALLRVARLEARMSSLKLRLMAASDDVARDQGARDAAALVTHHTRTDAGTNRRELAVAEALDRRWGRVAEALGSGEVNLAQAVVITRALDDLPRERIEPAVLAKAEAHLVAEAAHHGPRELRVLGRKILEVVAPEVYEDEEGRQLEAEERRSRERTSLSSKNLGDGTTRFVIRVPDAAASRLRTYLEAFTSPRHARPGGDEADRIPAFRRMGGAFCSFLEAVDPRRLPVHGGDATTVIVTIPLDDLQRELSAAGLATGDRISASEARRLACSADIIPAVLGGKSEVLDLGRSSRLFKPAQRKAMIIRDRECRAEGCTIPAAWCEAHHAKLPWTKGGRTDLDDGMLLCSWHHHRAHDPTYDSSRRPSGDVRFTRRR